ncbi:MAG TPA: type III pantothenate kinase [Pirellulaceae bacterium]|nr:type III pantothenate kinase [Pirellulaceae bacterium]
MPQAWFYADVGNSAVKLAWTPSLARKRPWAKQWTWLEESHRWQDLPKEPANWLVSSVHPRRLKWLSHRLKARRPRDTLRVLALDEIPMTVAVDEPRRLGIDRVLAAWAAWTLNGSKGPLIVLQAGTAVTVNIVDEQGTFRGGLIFPGLDLCRRVLAEQTAALPNRQQSRWPAPTSDKLPAVGRNTEEAIDLGTLHHQIGGMVHSVEHAQQEFQKRARVYVGGGGLADLSPWLPKSYLREPDLVLLAISNLAKLS